MSVPDMIRNVTQKAKDLPLHMLQTALSGVGQALAFGGLVRNKIKDLAGQEEDLEESREKAAGGPAEAAEKVGEEREEKPARREPIIFAPRPEKAAGMTSTTEGNGTKTTPEPVIFRPAKPRPAASETEARPETESKTVATPAAEPAAKTEPEAQSEAKPEPEAVATPAAVRPEPKAEPEPEPKTATEAGAGAEPEPEPKTEPEAEAVATPVAAEPAAETVASPAAELKAEPETAPGTPEIEVPAGVRVEVAEVEVAKPETADAAAVEVTATRAAGPEEVRPADVPAEPMPGYAGLTVASLRARMRGRSAEQIRELLAYERATLARDTVVRMYENRLAKLEAAE
ncbi:hypothetical protein FHS43_004751 [Streptosporangium becharense]|uniref:Uncharacterized protein n=1 Tax=Streptosporangium becharense TaxID=1816182 RepID=A0A7W9II52_9ACTN|nr:hypothetical protein [Streptosporangium becharense]MBB2913447.1 hypothetical protein [Streptosporangium becharense]MBB5821137.1 hypothetical protein [Streptosporangium becharense]